jgi:hypothetical protein
MDESPDNAQDPSLAVSSCGNPVHPSQVTSTLGYLKQAVANLSNAGHAAKGLDPAVLASIDRLLRGVLAEIRRLERLYPS